MRDREEKEKREMEKKGKKETEKGKKVTEILLTCILYKII